MRLPPRGPFRITHYALPITGVPVRFFLTRIVGICRWHIAEFGAILASSTVPSLHLGMKTRITFPPEWVSSQTFEDALLQALPPHENSVYDVTFVFPADCKIMVDAGTKLLSLANQLAESTKFVTLDFEEGEEGTMGYLNRMEFFDYLHAGIKVLPKRPAFSGSALYHGANPNLVEFVELVHDEKDSKLPSRMADTLMESVKRKSEQERARLHDTAFTIFSELIQNVYRHSDTKLSGYAAMQLYRHGGKVAVCVSDSGVGLMNTLRKSLKTYYPGLARRSDPEVLVEMVTSGVSRFGQDNGCGICQSARKALSYQASMEIRMPTSRVLLKPTPGARVLGVASYDEELPLLWGTHISFGFGLD